MKNLFKRIVCKYRFTDKKRFQLAFIMLIMLCNFNSAKAQSLINVTVDLTNVTWNLYCADGTDSGSPLGCVAIDGPDPRYKFRVGSDGGNFSPFQHVGASNSPQPGGPILDNESDTDGASIDNLNYRTEFSNQCITTINFDLDAWEEDILIFENPECPTDGNYVYNSSYSSLCTVGGEGDDSRESITLVYNLPNSNGSENVVFDFGAYSMTFNIARTIVAAPSVTSIPADNLICSGGTVELSSSTANVVWFADPLDPAGSVLGTGATYTSSPIQTFPFVIYCAVENGGCFGEFTEITINESAVPDSDFDGICDDNDQCPGEDDNIDVNNNGIPDACEGCNYSILNTNNFESGFGIWVDGGTDCARGSYAGFANSGTRSVQLRDNTTTSVVSTGNIDLTAYPEIKVDFSFMTNSMENGEDFWLQVSTNGGSTYTTKQIWKAGTDFNNNQRVNPSVIIDGPFTSTTRIRFRNDASNDNDLVYIDDVTILGCGSFVREAQNVDNPTPSGTEQNALNGLNKKLTIFPNPASSYINLVTNLKVNSIAIYDVKGVLINEILTSEIFGPIDISKLSQGSYFIVIQTDEGTLYEKFIKM
jgi:hypothetical protein